MDGSCTTGLLSKEFIYSLWGKRRQSQHKAIRQWDEVSRKLIRKCYTKGIQGISRAAQIKHTPALGLITIAS